MAAVAYFLKIDGIAGESKDAKIEDLRVVMKESKASPLLFLTSVSGKHFNQAVLTGRKTGNKPIDFLVIKLTEVFVSSYHTGGGTAAAPDDQVSLNFAKIEFSFTAQKADGSPDAPVKAGWDLKQNTKV